MCRVCSVQPLILLRGYYMHTLCVHTCMAFLLLMFV